MKQAIIDRNLFAAEFESIAIERIKKFHKIAQAYGFEIALGFRVERTVKSCIIYASEPAYLLPHITMLRLSRLLQRILSNSTTLKQYGEKIILLGLLIIS